MVNRSRGRDRVFVERERHANVRRGDLSYPVRAIRTADYFTSGTSASDRWPAGDLQQYVAVGPFGDIDGGPSKSLLLDRQSDPAIARTSNSPPRSAAEELLICAAIRTRFRTSPASPSTAKRRNVYAPIWIAG